MSIVKFPGPGSEVDEDRVRLVATFHELITKLGKGDLAGAARMQEELKKQGFDVKYRRQVRKGGRHASC